MESVAVCFLPPCSWYWWQSCHILNDSLLATASLLLLPFVDTDASASNACDAMSGALWYQAIIAILSVAEWFKIILQHMWMRPSSRQIQCTSILRQQFFFKVGLMLLYETSAMADAMASPPSNNHHTIRKITTSNSTFHIFIVIIVFIVSIAMYKSHMILKNNVGAVIFCLLHRTRIPSLNSQSVQ